MSPACANRANEPGAAFVNAIGTTGRSATLRATRTDAAAARRTGYAVAAAPNRTSDTAACTCITAASTSGRRTCGGNRSTSRRLNRRAAPRGRSRTTAQTVGASGSITIRGADAGPSPPKSASRSAHATGISAGARAPCRTNPIATPCPSSALAARKISKLKRWIPLIRRLPLRK